jgi:hypothetical protein
VGDAPAAFGLLTERLLADYAANPTRGSALGLIDIEPDAFAGDPTILVPLAAEC